MNLSLSHPLRRRMLKPAGEGGDSGTGTGTKAAEDYGDDFVPTDDDDPAAGAGADDSAAGANDPAAGTDDSAADKGGEGGEDGLRGAGTTDPGEGGKPGDKPATATPRAGKGGAIPLERHEKILAKERAAREKLEAELAASRAGREVAKHNDALEKLENDLVGLETSFNEALAAGDTAKARELQTQIRHKNAELTEAHVTQRTSVAVATAAEQMRYDTALERIEEAYPQLNPDHADYDEDLMDDVVDMLNAGKARGLTPTKALQRAVTRLLGAKTAKQESATTATPRVDEKDAAAAAEAEAARKVDAVKRNLDAARRAPPGHQSGQSSAALGGALTAKSVMSLSDEEYAKLGDKELARLRGDFVS